MPSTSPLKELENAALEPIKKLTEKINVLETMQKQAKEILTAHEDILRSGTSNSESKNHIDALKLFVSLGDCKALEVFAISPEARLLSIMQRQEYKQFCDYLATEKTQISQLQLK